MSQPGLTVIQPSDLDPASLTVDPVTHKVRVVPGSAKDDIYIAATIVSGHKALMFVAGGDVTHADPSTQFVYAGISLNAADAMADVTARRQGIVAAAFWNWQNGLPIFVAPDGVLTQVVPMSGYSMVVGFPVDPQTIYLSPEEAIYIGD